jgi:hypothetical protein
MPVSVSFIHTYLRNVGTLRNPKSSQPRVDGPFPRRTLTPAQVLQPFKFYPDIHLGNTGPIPFHPPNDSNLIPHTHVHFSYYITTHSLSLPLLSSPALTGLTIPSPLYLPPTPACGYPSGMLSPTYLPLLPPAPPEVLTLGRLLLPSPIGESIYGGVVPSPWLGPECVFNLILETLGLGSRSA